MVFWRVWEILFLEGLKKLEHLWKSISLWNEIMSKNKMHFGINMIFYLKAMHLSNCPHRIVGMLFSFSLYDVCIWSSNPPLICILLKNVWASFKFKAECHILTHPNCQFSVWMDEIFIRDYWKENRWNVVFWI